MVRLRTLGQCVVEVGETRLGPEAEVLFALALYLAVEAGTRISRERLCALLWPEADEERAAHCLRQSLYRLRTLGAAVRSDRSHVWLEPGDVDADFLQARRAHDPAAMEALGDRIHGGFLPGYAPAFSRAFGEWLEHQRDVANASARRVLLGAVEARRARGEWHAVEALSARCLTVDPLNEEATLASAEAAALQGGKAQALGIIDRYLKEIGPDASEIRLPAALLRRRIAEAPQLERQEPVRDAPFVGRVEEMTLLTRALQLAVAGQGSAHVVWGEPGIGKTRLTTEFCRAASLGRVVIERTGCQSHDERRPFSAYADLAPKLLTVPGAIGCAPESLRYLRRLYEHDPEETLPSPDTREAAVLYASIRRSILDLVDAIASEGPLILVIEDVHWLDRISWEMTRELAPWLASRRVLLLLTSRAPAAERARGVADVPGLRRRHLGPLDEASSRTLLRSLLARGGRPDDGELADWCMANGGGNPFHLSELALHGMRAGSGERRLPTTLTDVLSERIGQVGAVALRVLQACAILGKNSTVGRLESVLAMRRVALLECLDELAMHGLIVSEETRVQSKHDILSRAALDQMAPASRRLVHRHAAEVLERELSGTQQAGLQWDCAEHWQHAGDSGRALRLLRGCARHALEVGVPEEAAGLLERALRFARTAAERREVLGDTAGAWRLSGDWPKVVHVLHEMKAATEECETPPPAHDEFELLECEADWKCGGDVLPIFDRLLACVQSRKATASHKVEAATRALAIADNLCDAERARTVFASANPYAEYYDVAASSRLRMRLIFHSSFGDVLYGGAIAAQLVDLAQTRDTSGERVSLLFHAAYGLRAAGRVDEAIAVLQEAYAQAEQRSFGSLSAGIANTTAWTHLLTDDSDEAAWWCERAEEWIRKTADRCAASNVHFTRAYLELFGGDHTRSWEALQQGLAAAGSTKHPRLVAEAKALETLILLEEGRQQIATESIADLFAIYEKVRTFSALDFVVLALKRALQSQGQFAPARALIEDYTRNHRRDRYPATRRLTE